VRNKERTVILIFVELFTNVALFRKQRHCVITSLSYLEPYTIRDTRPVVPTTNHSRKPKRRLELQLGVVIVFFCSYRTSLLRLEMTLSQLTELAREGIQMDKPENLVHRPRALHTTHKALATVSWQWQRMVMQPVTALLSLANGMATSHCKTFYWIIRPACDTS
jgi:hypothetical protein